MNDSRTGLEGKTKCELVELVMAEVSAWPGTEPLAPERREYIREALSRLGSCRLWLGETHWHALCGIWLARSARPDRWLRSFWLAASNQWRIFLYYLCFEANRLPALDRPPQHRRRPSNYEPPEPGHLPFGFLKPWM